jgi:hypothetical protein
MNNIKVWVSASFAALFLTVAGGLQAQENTGAAVNGLKAAQAKSVDPKNRHCLLYR